MFEFFSSVWADFLNLSPANQAGIMLTFATPIVGFLSVSIATTLGFGRQKRIIVGLENQLSTLRDELRNQTKRTRDLELYALRHSPEKWVDRCRKEQRDGNDVLAVQGLEDGINRISAPLSKAATEIAEAYLGVSAETEAALNAAERYAQLASLIKPTDTTASMLLEHIRDATRDCKNEDIHELKNLLHIPSSVGEGMSLINLVHQNGGKAFEKGEYYLASCLYRRGVNISRKIGVYNQAVGLGIRFHEAKALLFRGRGKYISETINDLIAQFESVHGRDHEETLTARLLRINILCAVGEYQDAINSSVQLRPEMERVLGQDHPNIVALRCSYAAALSGASAYKKAIVEYKTAIIEYEKTLGLNHPFTIDATTHLAFAQHDLGDFESALSTASGHIETYIQNFGKEHPHVLRSKWLIAKCLYELGSLEKARSICKSILPIQLSCHGPNHLNVLETRELISKT